MVSNGFLFQQLVVTILLVAIMAIGSYFINDYWWLKLLNYRPLVVILSIIFKIFLLMVISGYSIGGY